MNSVWDKLYKKDSSFFGEEPSNFAITSYQRMKHGVKELLELGCGQGRDCLFFASKGISIKVLDYSKVAIDAVTNKATTKSLPIKAILCDASSGMPFPNGEFDAVYSHMFFNMHFTKKELRFLFDEVKRVLKPNGMHFFSVRNDKDMLYGKGKQLSDGIYDINGFQIRFFTKKDIEVLSPGFKIEDISEGFEDPASLYLVTATRL
jgi:SAM-dependent methyltransferase